jgi:hypothetical protein
MPNGYVIGMFAVNETTRTTKVQLKRSGREGCEEGHLVTGFLRHAFCRSQVCDVQSDGAQALEPAAAIGIKGVRATGRAGLVWRLVGFLGEFVKEGMN